MTNRCLALLVALLVLASAGALADPAGDASPPCDLLSATPLFPVGGPTNAVVPFAWRGPQFDPARLPVDLGIRYAVWISRNQEPFVFLGATDDTTLTRFLPPGGYAWFVGVSARGCEPRRSEVARFLVPARSNCPSAGPGLVEPADQAAIEGASVALRWNAVPDADAYVVWLQRDPDAPYRAAVTRRNAATIDLASGAYSWRVEALVSGCPPVTSSGRSFSVTACEIPKAIPLSPPDGSFGVESPVTFRWSEVDEVEEYNVWLRMSRGEIDSPPVLAGTTEEEHLEVPFPSIPLGTLSVEWWVEAVGEGGCRSISAPRTLTVAAVSGCPEPREPRMAGPARVGSGQTFRLGWTPVPAVATYEVEEAAAETFEGATLLPPQAAPVLALTRVVTEPTTFYYRVRAISSCGPNASAFSTPIAVQILPELDTVDATAAGTASGTIDLCLTGGRIRRCGPGESGDNAAEVTLTLAADRPWITVVPATVTFPPNGRATVTVTADARVLPLGTNRAALTATAAAGAKANGVTTGGTVSVSLTLVTPVSAVPAAEPTPGTLVIPAVAHADGVASTWESDLRLVNLAPTTVRYRLTFTPSGADGTLTGQTTDVDVAPGTSLALDDVLQSWYGAESATGALAIQPLDEPSGFFSSGPFSLASSRTFNVSPGGTFGQFIPAIPFSDFIGKFDEAGAAQKVSLQQIAQSALFRTNVGLVEGAGEPADVELRVFDPVGTAVATHLVSLAPREHRQIDQLLGSLGLTLDDARVEVAVTSATGKITAYASRVDNRTGDPFVVFARPAKGTASRWVVPGVAALETGQASWRTDLRIHNGGTEPVAAAVRYFDQNSAQPARETTIEIAPGAIAAMDDVLVSAFGIADGGGAIHVETAAPAPLTVTAQTYNLASTGTYGQFIPAVTVDEAVGVGERTLQLLQVEESARFRTNLGLAEVSGNEVTVEISAVVPESTVVPKSIVTLAPNQFLQIPSIIRQLNLPSAYNGRVAVRAIGGTGRVTAYASMIDNATQDPTYVPAQ